MRNFLKKYLKFYDTEIDDMKITETSMAAKRDNVIYVAFQDISDIREIRIRIAECKNPVITARNYVPPQLYNRYMYLNKLCSTLRAKDETLKTQLRFTNKDIEVLTKEKGSDNPFKPVSLCSLVDLCDLPSFDSTKKWRQRLDRPPRRKVNYSNTDDDDEDESNTPASRKPRSPPSRQNSIADLPRKKSRRHDATTEDPMDLEDPLDISDVPAGTTE